jgi:hypothetical protein
MRTIRTLVLLASILALALFAAGCGDDDSSSSKDAKTNTEIGGADGSGTDDSGDFDKTFQVQVHKGEVVGGPQAIKVKSGDKVQIQILSDADDEAHLHGIDKEVELEAGMPAVLEFTAKDQGSYELEGHDTGLVYGTVEVS